jgi:hypothetical protein
MLQVVYKGTFLFGHLNNANKQLIYVWSHAVSVGIQYMVEQHAGVQI